MPRELIQGNGHGAGSHRVRLGDAGGGPPAARGPARAGGGLRRRLIAALVALGTIAIAVMIVRWAGYRYRYVVSSDATLKGYVSYVGARIPGKVASIAAEDGQEVHRGEVIARLEDQAYRAAVVRAQSDLERAIKERERAQISLDYDRQRLILQVASAEAALKAAEAELTAAEAVALRMRQDYNRSRSLIDKNWNTMADLNFKTAERDQSQAAVVAAKARRQAAELALKTARVELDGLRSRVAALEVLAAQVEVARAALGVAEADLDATYIRAPEDGWIVRRFIDAGGSVRLGYPILAMRLGRRAWVEAWVHESQVAQIRIGSPAEVAFGALPGRIFHGRVEAIGALAHTELQGAIVPPTLGQLIRPPTMVDIRIALVENNERLVPGLTALVGISRNSAGVASSEGGPHAKAGTREALPSGVDEIRGFSGAQRSPPATATAEDGPPLTEAGKAGG